MAPTILITGATGNTGRNVIETLSHLRKTSDVLSGHRIVGLTRSAKGSIAQEIAKLPGIEIIEKNWMEISADWLRENEVVRAFVASQPQPAQFSEESTFLIAALEAGVKYVVRISTAAPNVRPDCKAFYARTHWAIEAMLSTPEFEQMHWTSIQPNSFSRLYLQNAANLIKQYRKTGKQETLRILGTADAPVGLVDAHDIGVLAARLLVESDTARHNKGRYIINGPEDITGNQIVKMVEKYIGTSVENVSFEDVTFIDAWADSVPNERLFILSIKHALTSVQQGLCNTSTTSKEVLEVAPAMITAAEVLESLLQE